MPTTFKAIGRILGSPSFLLLYGVGFLALTVALLLQGIWTLGSVWDLTRPASGLFGGSTLILLGLSRWGRGDHRGERSTMSRLAWVSGLLFAVSYALDVFGPALF